jgi:hypothetical protein
MEIDKKLMEHLSQENGKLADDELIELIHEQKQKLD